MTFMLLVGVMIIGFSIVVAVAAIIDSIRQK